MILKRSAQAYVDWNVFRHFLGILLKKIVTNSDIRLKIKTLFPIRMTYTNLLYFFGNIKLGRSLIE